MATATIMNFRPASQACSHFTPVPGEQDWLNWLRKARDQAISPTQAAEKMGITELWLRRLLSEPEPASALVSPLEAR